jgi:hypothetical protein
MKARDHFEDLDVDDRIILEWVEHVGVEQIHLLILVFLQQ